MKKKKYVKGEGARNLEAVKGNLISYTLKI